MKRALDFVVALTVLVLTSPLLLVVMFAIWLQDRRSPFYAPLRAARGGGSFKMVKFRSMVVNADKTGVTSTSGDDYRITRVGRFVRAYKIDELAQLWNVLKGEMSLVGPRPQVLAAVALYTTEEQRLLTVRPGITDPASIVFSDEGKILEGSNTPDLLYDQIIRPWKSRLALLYVDHRSLAADLRLLFLTAVAIVSREKALRGLQSLLIDWHAGEMLCRVALRAEPLRPYPPPGTVIQAGEASVCRHPGDLRQQSQGQGD
jgi:lipopolysaccharide/colanic/teichoic acid biosynthesis glycosyltransferase